MKSSRRTIVKSMFAAAAATSMPLAWAADVVKIGYVSPQTGPLAPFGEADKWVIEQMKLAFKDGITIAGNTGRVRIVRDRAIRHNGRAIGYRHLVDMLTHDGIAPTRHGKQRPTVDVGHRDVVLLTGAGIERGSLWRGR